MAILTKAEVDAYLGTTVLQADFDAIYPMAYGKLLADTGLKVIESADVTETIGRLDNPIRLHSLNITALKTVNGTSFTSKVRGTDWQVRFGRQLAIVDIETYLSALVFAAWDVTYTAGWAAGSIPQALKTACLMLFAQYYGRRQAAQGVASYAIGEEKVTYGDAFANTFGDTSNDPIGYRSTIKQYVINDVVPC